MIVNQVILV